MLIVLGFPRYIQLFWLQGPDSNKFCFDQSAMGSSSSKQNPTEEIMRLVVLCLFQKVLLTFVLFKINCYPCRQLMQLVQQLAQQQVQGQQGQSPGNMLPPWRANL